MKVKPWWIKWGEVFQSFLEAILMVFLFQEMACNELEMWVAELGVEKMHCLLVLTRLDLYTLSLNQRI